MFGGGGGRRRILNKDYTLLKDDQDPDDIEMPGKSGASAWRLVGLAKEQALVSCQTTKSSFTARPEHSTFSSSFSCSWSSRMPHSGARFVMMLQGMPALE